MYKSYYGMSANPFDKQLSEKDAFASADHKEATSRLAFLKNIRGVGVITSSPGLGKTFALRCFAKSIDRNLYEAVYICLSTISVTEFYRQICLTLGIDIKQFKTAMFRAIKERVYCLFKEKKKPLILLLDEAHELSTEILKDLKMIMNHDYDSVNCFTLVLSGEPHLNKTLEKTVHEALRQRIAVHYNFSGLSDNEVLPYINHKLRVVGAAESIFGEDALPAAIGYARGCPRVLDSLMNEAFMLGAQLQKPTVDAETMMAAVNNMALS